MIAIPRIIKICVCGNEFQTTPNRIKDGRGKFCSTKCARSKPVPELQKQIQRAKMLGRHCSPATQFKKGHKTWNTGLKGIMAGENSPHWVGDKIGYMGLHDWVEKELGKPQLCSVCKKTDGRIEWANKSHQYKRDVDDWIRLCKRCHIKYDRASGAWGMATRRFAL